MKKFFIRVLTPLITILLVVIKLDAVETSIKNNLGPHATDIIGIILAALSLYIYYFNIILPYINYERIAKSRWVALNDTIESFIKEYAEFLEINATIMVPKTRFFVMLEPTRKDKGNKKLTLISRVFKTVWQDEKNPLDQRFRFTINQGLCGKVYRSGGGVEGAVLLPGQISGYNFNFTTEQESYIKDLVILISCPIKVFEHADDGPKRKTIGVLNIESRTVGAEKWILDKEKKDAFFEGVRTLEKLIRNLL